MMCDVLGDTATGTAVTAAAGMAAGAVGITAAGVTGRGMAGMVIGLTAEGAIAVVVGGTGGAGITGAFPISTLCATGRNVVAGPAGRVTPALFAVAAICSSGTCKTLKTPLPRGGKVGVGIADIFYFSFFQIFQIIFCYFFFDMLRTLSGGMSRDLFMPVPTASTASLTLLTIGSSIRCGPVFPMGPLSSEVLSSSETVFGRLKTLFNIWSATT